MMNPMVGNYLVYRMQYIQYHLSRVVQKVKSLWSFLILILSAIKSCWISVSNVNRN